MRSPRYTICLATIVLAAAGCAAHKASPLPTYHGLDLSLIHI